MYYLIREVLTECTMEEALENEEQFVAVLTLDEWNDAREKIDMGIELEVDPAIVYSTKVELNYDSMTGSVSIPRRDNFEKKDIRFSYVLDERGIVFIDNGENAMKIVKGVKKTKRWGIPSLERFLYDFFEYILRDDQNLLDSYEKELERMEAGVTRYQKVIDITRVHEMRGDISDLRSHYEQLLDVGEVLEENDNHFFREDRIRYFQLLVNRVERLETRADFLRDYTIQIRDLYQSQLDVKQNRIMTVLTVVTTVFMPLTLITGWYGMNFRYMPELDEPWGYPAVILVSLLIVVGSLLFFRKKDWL